MLIETIVLLSVLNKRKNFKKYKENFSEVNLGKVIGTKYWIVDNRIIIAYIIMALVLFITSIKIGFSKDKEIVHKVLSVIFAPFHVFYMIMWNKVFD